MCLAIRLYAWALKLLLREHIWSAPFLLVRMLSSNSYSLYASKQALDTPIYIVTITIYTVFNLSLDIIECILTNQNPCSKTLNISRTSILDEGVLSQHDRDTPT